MYPSFPYSQGLPGFKGSEGYLGEEGTAVSQGFFQLHLFLRTYLCYEIICVNSEGIEKSPVLRIHLQSLRFFQVTSVLLTYCPLLDYPPTLYNQLNEKLLFFTRRVKSLPFPPSILHE